MTDDDLRDLLTDAVSDVEPAYRLGEIQARVHRPARRGWYAAGGAILAAAAVVTAVSVVNDDGPRRGTPAADAQRTAALYFVGDTPAGPRLYREFQKVSGGPLADVPDEFDSGHNCIEIVTAGVGAFIEIVEVDVGRRARIA